MGNLRSWLGDLVVAAGVVSGEPGALAGAAGEPSSSKGVRSNVLTNDGGASTQRGLRPRSHEDRGIYNKRFGQRCM